ncbi:unnamed protein product [Ixodes pacificus]
MGHEPNAGDRYVGSSSIFEIIEAAREKKNFSILFSELTRSMLVFAPTNCETLPAIRMKCQPCFTRWFKNQHKLFAVLRDIRVQIRQLTTLIFFFIQCQFKN